MVSLGIFLAPTVRWTGFSFRDGAAALPEPHTAGRRPGAPGGRQRASAPLTRYVHLRLIEASMPTATAFQEDFHPRRLNFRLVVPPCFGISSLVKYKPTVSTKPGVALPLPTCSWTRPDTGP